MPYTPPKYRGKDSVGQVPKPRPGAMEPPERHRCHVCGEVGTGRVRAVIGLKASDKYICPPCLEAEGQGNLLCTP